MAERNNAEARSLRIAAAGIELQFQERYAVDCILRYLTALPDDDAQKQIWNKHCSRRSFASRMGNRQRCRKTGSSWWTAAFRSVICAKENKCKKLQSYFDLPEWWNL